MTHVAEAAIRLADGRVFSVPAPGRHCDVIARITREVSLAHVSHEHTQGFLTSEGAFVNREEAARIAYAAGQIPEPKASGILFSEDVW